MKREHQVPCLPVSVHTWLIKSSSRACIAVLTLHAVAISNMPVTCMTSKPDAGKLDQFPCTSPQGTGMLTNATMRM